MVMAQTQEMFYFLKHRSIFLIPLLNGVSIPKESHTEGHLEGLSLPKISVMSNCPYI